jgi:large subunit ribosomal protein L9
MKVVLIKDVRDMGLKGSVIEVSDGHAINFLLPRKMAIAASAKNVEEASLRQKQNEDRKAIDVELLKQNIASLNEKRIVLIMKANDKGHLYEAVAAPEIIKAAKDQADIDLPAEAVKLEKPIKEVGEYKVSVSGSGVSGEFTIVVEAAS